MRSFLRVCLYSLLENVLLFISARLSWSINTNLWQQSAVEGLEKIERSYYFAALELANRGEYKAALHLLDVGIAEVPKGLRLHLLMGRMYSDMQRFGLAVNALNRAYTLAPTNPYVLSSLGMNVARLGEKRQGIAMLLLGLREMPLRNHRYISTLGCCSRTLVIGVTLKLPFENALKLAEKTGQKRIIRSKTRVYPYIVNYSY